MIPLDIASKCYQQATIAGFLAVVLMGICLFWDCMVLWFLDLAPLVFGCALALYCLRRSIETGEYSLITAFNATMVGCSIYVAVVWCIAARRTNNFDKALHECKFARPPPVSSHGLTCKDIVKFPSAAPSWNYIVNSTILIPIFVALLLSVWYGTRLAKKIVSGDTDMTRRQDAPRSANTDIYVPGTVVGYVVPDEPTGKGKDRGFSAEGSTRANTPIIGSSVISGSANSRSRASSEVEMESGAARNDAPVPSNQGSIDNIQSLNTETRSTNVAYGGVDAAPNRGVTMYQRFD